MDGEKKPHPIYIHEKTLAGAQSEFEKIQDDLEKVLSAEGISTYKTGDLPTDDRIRTRHSYLFDEQSELIRELESLDRSGLKENREHQIQDAPITASPFKMDMRLQHDDDDAHRSMKINGDEVPVKPLITLEQWEQLFENGKKLEKSETHEEPASVKTANDDGIVLQEVHDPPPVKKRRIDASEDASSRSDIDVHEGTQNVDKNPGPDPTQAVANTMTWSTWFLKFFSHR